MWQLIYSVMRAISRNAFKILGAEIGSGSFVSFTARIRGAHNIRLGENCYVQSQAVLNARSGSLKIGCRFEMSETARIETRGGAVVIGDNCSINSFSIIYGQGGVRIGNGVRIAANTVIISENHVISKEVPFFLSGTASKGISIGSNCWIGTGCTVLDGVSISDNVVIAAGSVVTKDCVADSIYAGVPAKRMRGV